MPLHRFIGHLALLLCCGTVAGCRGGASTSENAHRIGSVTHIVIFWLKDAGSAADRQALTAACHTLKDIPGVTDLRVGHVLPSTRPVVDSSYDVALAITFRDEHALHAYGPHPIHQKLLTDLGPTIAKVQIYDFTNR